MNYFLVIVAFQALFLSLLFFLNLKSKKEDFFLIGFFGAIFIHITYKIFLSVWFDNFIFERLHSSISLLYPPILYFYTLKINGEKLTNMFIIKHFIPFIILTLLNVYLFFSLLFNKDLLYFTNFYSFISIFLFLPSLLFYSYSSLKKTQKRNVEKQLSIKYKIVKIISYLLILSALLIIIGLLLAIIKINSPINFRYIYYTALLLVMFAVLNYRIQFFYTVDKKQMITTELVQTESRYKNYHLNDDEMQNIINKIKLCFNAKKIYLNNELSLDMLAQEINIPKIKISQALNIKLNTNFYNYVNSYRIEESKKLIAKSQKVNLTDIYFDCGFKNKSTFYKNFKFFNGITPSQYKKSID